LQQWDIFIFAVSNCWSLTTSCQRRTIRFINGQHPSAQAAPNFADVLENRKSQLPQELRATRRQQCVYEGPSKLSRKTHPRNKHHVDGQTGGKIMVIFYIQDGRQPPSWILLNRKSPFDPPTPKTLA